MTSQGNAFVVASVEGGAFASSPKVIQNSSQKAFLFVGGVTTRSRGTTGQVTVRVEVGSCLSKGQVPSKGKNAKGSYRYSG